MDLFLNELSLQNSAPTIQEAIRRLELIGTLLGLMPKFVDGIRGPENLLNIEIGPDFRLSDWVYKFDSETQDIKTLIVKRVNNAPYIEDIFDNETSTKLVDFTFDGIKCVGLGLASPIMFNTISISFDVAEWKFDSITIDAEIITEDDFESCQACVKHISQKEHFTIHERWLSDRQKPTVRSGRELWVKRSILFPNLLFCRAVQNQLSWLNQSNPEFSQIVHRLNELNDFCKYWPVDSAFDPDRFQTKVTPESSSRLSKFRNKLTIECPDGISRLFSWHARFTPGAGRIHFIEDTSSRQLVIGSIANQNEIK